MNAPTVHRRGIAGPIARAFVDSKLTPLLLVASVILGLVAIVALPREEEPQINVPMVDVMLAMPGASAEEVESRVSTPARAPALGDPGRRVRLLDEPAGPVARSSCASRWARTTSGAGEAATRSSRPTPTVSPRACRRRSSRRARSTTSRSWPSRSTRAATTTSRSGGSRPRWTQRSSTCPRCRRRRSSAGCAGRCASASTPRRSPRDRSAPPRSRAQLGQSNSQASAGSLTVANPRRRRPDGRVLHQRRRRRRGGRRRLPGQSRSSARRGAAIADGAEDPNNYVFFGERRGATSAAANQERRGHARGREAAGTNAIARGRRRARAGRSAEAHR